MSKRIQKALANLSALSAKLCIHSPAAHNVPGTEAEYAEAGRVLLLQLAKSVDEVANAVAFEAGLSDDYRPLWEALDGNLLWLLEKKATEAVDLREML